MHNHIKTNMHFAIRVSQKQICIEPLDLVSISGTVEGPSLTLADQDFALSSDIGSVRSGRTGLPTWRA